MGRKKTGGDFKQVGFRLPVEHHEVLTQVATARGIDLSALLNQLVADALPGLRHWLQGWLAQEECRLELERYRAAKAAQVESEMFARRIPEASLPAALALADEVARLPEEEQPAALKAGAKRARDPAIAGHAQMVLMIRELVARTVRRNIFHED